jgi:glycosyltransferase involved in cell wall biosynthesis
MIKSTTDTLVSVIVTTKNEEQNIETCLQSIQLQTWPNLEIIVVDNRSTDRTREIASKYTEHVYQKGPERSAQRNYGMLQIAQGEYVIYVDADMILSPILLDAAIPYLQQTGAIALHIGEIVLGRKYLSRVRRFERNFYDGTPIDGARIFQRKAFSQVGGFDETIFAKGSGEDWDLDKKIKTKGTIALLPRYLELPSPKWPLDNFVENRGVQHSKKFTGIYHNESEFDLKSYLKKKAYYSFGFEGYIRKWGKEDPDIQLQFGLTYRLWTIFSEKGKWKKLIKSPILVIGMYTLRVLVGLIFTLRTLKIEE